MTHLSQRIRLDGECLQVVETSKTESRRKLDGLLRGRCAHFVRRKLVCATQPATCDGFRMLKLATYLLAARFAVSSKRWRRSLSASTAVVAGDRRTVIAIR